MPDGRAALGGVCRRRQRERERPADDAVERERERERRQARPGRRSEMESAARSLGSSVPTAAQHTSTFSRLSFPFFSSAAATGPSPARRVRRSSSGPRAPLSISPSRSRRRDLARAREQTVLLFSIQQFAFSSSSVSSPLIRRPPPSSSLSPCARVSSRTTGRSCNLGARIYARINHRGKRSRGERGSARARTERANGRM